MEWKFLLMLLLGAMGLFLMGATIWKPVKVLVRLGLYFITGLVLLVALNIFLGFLGLHIAINPITALLAGVLHVPGIILLVVLNYLFVL